MKAVSEELSQVMNNNEYKMRMNDVRSYYEKHPIVRVNSANEKCQLFTQLGENACDGTGFLWFKDMKRQLDLIDGNYKRQLDDNGNLIPMEWQTECACNKLKKRAKLISTSGIPIKFKEARFKNYSLKYTTDQDIEKATYAKHAAEKFVENYESIKQQQGAKGLYLYSKRKGSGKSRLLATMANELILKGIDVTYINAVNLAKEVRNTFKKDSLQNETQVLEAIVKTEVLFIDDLAVDKPSRFVEDLYYKIFNERLEKGLLTVIASNLTIREFGTQTYLENGIQQSYADVNGDSRTGSRLKAMCYELYMPEESIRDREAEYQDKQFEKILFGGN